MFRKLMEMETEALRRLAGDGDQKQDGAENSAFLPSMIAAFRPVLPLRFAVCSSRFDR
ncbi:hypothetical protein NFI95_00895 [Acetobacteraceae bacterium KSS8]|uniref:Uncharacterized protein n=1 Tax=Endosaccharibacter trunci TaxID=2812733 RepID=A0ABT1W431_9PROT|nr:hypothetical protein [Acetobacteraceae bacterium KSS8]